jgi:flagellar biosynthesis/type III secretory pathway chaperone
MMAQLESLIAALRDELQQYGEMLALLDREQELVLRRASSELFDSVSAIQGQAVVLQTARRHREECRAELATALGRPADAPISELMGLVPSDYRPLLDALIRENNHLLVRVQQRARQNHLLLTRSLELMQRFIATLFPSRDSQVYDDHGARPSRLQPLQSLYEAVG